MAIRNKSQFDRAWKKTVKDLDSAIEKTVRAAALEMFGEIVRRTPVGNPSLWKVKPEQGYVGGTLRGNWQVKIGAPATNELRVSDKGGNLTIRNGASELGRYSLNGRPIWFSNNLPYAQSVEDGSSTQTPNGMVKTVLPTFDTKMAKLARANKI